MVQIGSRSGVHLVQCQCSFISVDLGKWQYPFRDKDYYKSEDILSPLVPLPFVSHRVKALGRYLRKGLVADLGSGPGHTAVALALAGYEAIGVEESRVAIDAVKETFPSVEWRNCGIHDYLREPRVHDGITLYHVLEHIPEPGQVCHLARERLRSGGVLAIEVPDVSSGQARLRGNNWGMYIPDHVNYFTTATLRRLLEPIGFRLVGKERKYHFAWPNGVWWRDVMHEAFSAVGMHSIITTYWRL